MIVFYFAMQAINYFKAKPATTTTGGGNQAVGSGAPPPGAIDQLGNMFPKGTKLDMYVYISESNKFDEFENERALFWMIPDLEYGNWNIGKDDDGYLTYENKIELTPVR